MSIVRVAYVPRNLRELENFHRDLNLLISQDAPRHYRIDATRARASDQRLLPLVNASNKLSVQSVQPLTASDSGGGLAEIEVAAHTVQFGFGTVGYNAGTITGLLNSTLYYVYADDESYEGGAVAYRSTTNPNLVTADSGRYYLGNVTTPAGGGGSSGGNWGGGGGGGGHPLP